MPRFLLAFAICFGSLRVFPQIPLWQWAIQLASPGNEQAFAITIGPGGDLLVGGSFDGNLGALLGIPFNAPNAKDGFIVSYSQTGTFQWASRIGGTSDQVVKSIATDAGGKIYVTGYFEGTADFDPLLFSTYFLSSAGNRDGFLACYTASGALDWALSFGSPGDDEGASVSVTGNSVFVAGYVQPGAVVKSTTGGTLSAVATQSLANCFLGAFTTAGLLQWVTGAGSDGDDQALSVVSDTSRVFVTGYYSGPLAVYNATGTTNATLQAQTGNLTDVFVLSYDHAGGVGWMTNAASTGADLGTAITQDSATIYVAGGFSNSNLLLPYPSPTYTISNAGGSDIFLAALQKSNGAWLWASTHTGSAGNNELALAITKQPQKGGHIFVGGTYSGLLSYTAQGGPALTSSGGEDVFVTGFTDQGVFSWNSSAGGAGTDSPYGLASSTTGAVFACGEYSTGIQFGGISLLNLAGRNVFIAKTGCEGISNNTVTGTQTVCVTQAPSTFNGSVPIAAGGGTIAYAWQRSTNQVNWQPAPGASTGQHYTPPTLAGTTYFRRVIQASGTCTFAANVVTVTVDQLPTPSVAGNSLAVCVPSVALNANLPATGSGSWSVISGAASIDSLGHPSAIADSLAFGTNLLAWTISNGVCPPSTSTLLVWREAPPAPVAAGANQTVCATSVTLSAASPTTGLGSWSVLSGTASILNPNSPSTSVVSLQTGTTQFLWTVVNGVCPPATATVVVQRDAVPGPVTISGQQTVCGASATVSAASPTAGTGQWSVMSGGGAIAIPSLATNTIANLQVGINVVEWKVSNGVCAPASSTLIVQRDGMPTAAVAGTNQSVCGPSATLTGNQPLSGTGNWSVLSGNASVTNSQSATTGVSGLTAGAHVFAWTIQNGVCPPSVDQVTVTSFPPPSGVSAGASQTLCVDNGSLNAATPAAGTGSWTSPPGIALSNSFNPVSPVSGIPAGIHVFMWTVTSGVCTPVTSTVSITRLAQPGPAAAGSNTTVCQPSLSLTAATPTAGIGQWSLVSGQATISAPGSPTSAVTLSTGSHVLVWTVVNGICPAAADTLHVTRDALPDPALAAPDQTVCTAQATVTANQPVTGQGVWLVTAGNASLSTTTGATSTAAPLDPGKNSFVWTISNGVCPPSGDTLHITRDLPPTPAAAGPDQTICANATTLTANQPAIGTNTWQSISGGGMLISPGNYTTPVTALSTGTNLFVYTIANGVCPVSADTVIVFRDAPPSPAVAGTDQSVCAVSATLAAADPATGTGQWHSQGSATVLNPFSAGSSVNNLSTGINQFVWTTSNGACPPFTDTVMIFRFQEPSEAQAGPDQTVCSASTQVTAVVPLTGTGMWKLAGGNANIPAPLQANTNVVQLSYGPVILIWSVVNGVCPTKSDTMTIIRDLEPDIAEAGSNIAVCGFSTVVAGNVPATGSSSWTIVTGGATVDHPSLPETAFHFTAEGTVIARYTVRNGVCPENSDSITVSVSFPPGPADAGSDQRICQPHALLSATSPTAGQGTWTFETGQGSIANPSSPQTQALSLPVGESILRWTISNSICEAVMDELTITRDTLRENAQAGSDIVTDLFTTRLDATPSQWPGTWTLVSGRGVIGEPGNPRSEVAGLGPGTNVFRWTITRDACGHSSDEVSVFLEDMVIPNGLSPNGDGRNDQFYITGLGNYRPVHLQIYNRWGAVVYNDPDYQNTWSGTNQSGELLVDDTYYYVLRIPDKGEFTGFITIRTR